MLDIKDGEFGEKIIKVIIMLALGHGPRYKPGGARELAPGTHLAVHFGDHDARLESKPDYPLWREMGIAALSVTS